MSPSPSRQKIFTILLGATLLAAVALWSAYWLFARDKAGDRLAGIRETLRQSGTNIECGNEHWSGFPFRIALACTPLSITVSAASAPITIDFSRIDLLAQAYDLRHVIAIAAPPAKITGLSEDALSLQYRKAVASFEDRGAAGNEPMHIIAAVDHLSADAPLLREHPLDALSLEGALRTGPLSLMLDQLELRRQQISVHGSGRLALDESRRLDGRLKLSVERLDMLLADLARAGLLSEKETDAGASLLTLLGSKNRRVNLELKLDRGRVYLGPFKLGELPPLRW
jgi:hypothetical protein